MAIAVGIQPLALRKLRMLNQARTLADLRVPPGNRLELLKGERRGQYSIRTDEELLPNPHPGEILAEEFMRPLGLSQNALARSLRVPPRRINELV